MNNLSTPSNYQVAPTATPLSLQKGGRGYRHKKNCKCRLCKKRVGGSNDILVEDEETISNPEDDDSVKIDIKDEYDIETGTTSIPRPKNEEINSNLDMKNDFNFASDEDYDDYDEAEKGFSGPFKAGGSRRRKRKQSKKTKKGRKSRKTRRHNRKSTFRKRRGKH
jgi:hypothetical protein